MTSWAGVWHEAPMVLAVLWAAAAVLWLVSVRVRNVSIVDIAWAPAFALGAAVMAWRAGACGWRGGLVVAVLLVWAIRLGTHLARRLIGHDEDARYQAIRRRWDPGFWYKSLAIVFWFQATLVAVVSLPAWAIIVDGAADPSRPLGRWDALAAGIALIGIFIEAAADAQLVRFRADVTKRGEVLNTGLWCFSRHPNYFGNFVLWWGLGLWAVSIGAYWALIGPAIMTFLLLRVSGVALLESTIGSRRPGYAHYIATTSAFFPWPPKAKPDSSKIR
ncbi:MAG: DUF1295 domain-containing protein [Myxococcales bacterium]|nr:DUF1295 domain-containing protein [Myxococcales bacterium]